MTIKLHGLDHNLLTSYIDIDGNVDIQKEQRTHLRFDRNRIDEYREELDVEIALIPQDTSAEDIAHAFFTACIRVATRLFASTRRAPPRCSARVLTIKNDVNGMPSTSRYSIREKGRTCLTKYVTVLSSPVVT